MSTAIALSSSPLSAPAATGSAKHFPEYDFTFHDLVSIINPLQHLPIVATIYRNLTGDTIKPFERIAGDTLYGGMWGCASAVANVVYQEATGKDFGQQVLDFVTGLVDGAQTATGTVTDASSSASSTSTDGSTPPALTAASLDPNMGAVTLMPLSLPALSAAPTGVASPKSPTTTADGPPRGLQMPQVSPSTTDSATLALMNALSNKGIDPALSQRAVSAYKKSLQTQPSDQTPKTPVPTS